MNLSIFSLRPVFPAEIRGGTPMGPRHKNRRAGCRGLSLASPLARPSVARCASAKFSLSPPTAENRARSNFEMLLESKTRHPLKKYSEMNLINFAANVDFSQWSLSIPGIPVERSDKTGMAMLFE